MDFREKSEIRSMQKIKKNQPQAVIETDLYSQYKNQNRNNIDYNFITVIMIKSALLIRNSARNKFLSSLIEEI
ncbi:CLUMA_CG021105, isoform A [Clunio marinus]|uniref:CLUMA_CG021105, isoform A n=1 Tax=Clunio marinus TaxID=568069 RepID=A0A1J1J6N0_9DIPT|nr:CLUMA_CG021105, isoform A [Clunio marinus]